MLNPNFDEVKPGDLITAELINYILSLLEDIEEQIALLVGSVGTGPVLVPNLFGRPLGATLSILGQSAVSLNVGQVIDVFGNPIDPDLPAEHNRTVLHQFPIPGVRVAVGSTVDLLVSGEGDGGTPPDPTEVRIDGFSPTNPRLNTVVAIFGANFAPVTSQNQVTFDGVPGALGATSSPQMLSVTVPSNIPNPPTGNATRSVLVIVATPTGQASANLTVRAAQTDTPTITEIRTGANVVVTPNTGVITVGDTISITGSNFGGDIGALRVMMGNNQAEIESLEVVDDENQVLQVNVPLLDGHAGGQQLVTASLIVHVGETNQTAPFVLRVFNPNV